MALITKDALIRLQKQLKTDALIGEKFGVSRQAIHQLRDKYGIESVIAKNDIRNQKILEAYKKGKPGTDLAEKFDLSISQTYRIINETNPQRSSAKKTTKKKK